MQVSAEFSGSDMPLHVMFVEIFQSVLFFAFEQGACVVLIICACGICASSGTMVT